MRKRSVVQLFQLFASPVRSGALYESQRAARGQENRRSLRTNVKISSWMTAFAGTLRHRACARTVSDKRRQLGALIARVGPFALQVKSTHSPFEALLEAILFQQLHANAARAILGRLLADFGDLHPSPELLLAAPEEMLRAAGLSRANFSDRRSRRQNSRWHCPLARRDPAFVRRGDY